MALLFSMKYLKQHLNVLTTPEKICIGIPTTKQYVEITNSSDNLKVLDDVISKGISSEYITKNSFLNELKERDMLTDRVSIDRAELYFEYLGQNLDYDKIAKYRILILGAGAGGSSLCYNLCQFGFNDVSIVDDDIVNESDVKKTPYFRKCRIGISKVIAISQEVEENFGVHIKSYTENISSVNRLKNLIEEVKPDLIVKACDPDLWFRKSLNNICKNNNIPFFNIAYSYENIVVGPTYLPSRKTCDLAYEKLIKANCGEHYDFDYIKKRAYKNLIHPSISFNVNILASLALREILFLSLEKLNFVKSISSIVRFNPISYKSTIIPLKCDSDCEICR